MGANLTQPNTQHGRESGNHRGQDHASPQDPRTNTRPPGNGDRDVRETERSEQGLLKVLGR
ncbi:MAG: hypothetical protein QOE08_2185 [Thermoleophilaceae bacterium]|jgi:hypothetical protein|nr:hypothetical protein [Thermoleophilaceae bacterium]